MSLCRTPFCHSQVFYPILFHFIFYLTLLLFVFRSGTNRNLADNELRSTCASLRCSLRLRFFCQALNFCISVCAKRLSVKRGLHTFRLTVHLAPFLPLPLFGIFPTAFPTANVMPNGITRP